MRITKSPTPPPTIANQLENELFRGDFVVFPGKCRSSAPKSRVKSYYPGKEHQAAYWKEKREKEVRKKKWKRWRAMQQKRREWYGDQEPNYEERQLRIRGGGV